MIPLNAHLDFHHSHHMALKDTLSRIQLAIFGRREDEDDEKLIGDEDVTIADLNRTIGVKSKYQLFRTYRGFLEEDPNPLLT